MDLIEIAPQANPPVCKILEFSKFRYDLEKKQKEARKKQKAGLLKEIRMRPHIASHDLEVKVTRIQEFLKEHDKVRITIVFRGREMQHKEVGLHLLKNIQERLDQVATLEQAVPIQERNRVMITLIPKH